MSEISRDEQGFSDWVLADENEHPGNGVESDRMEDTAIQATSSGDAESVADSQALRDWVRPERSLEVGTVSAPGRTSGSECTREIRDKGAQSDFVAYVEEILHLAARHDSADWEEPTNTVSRDGHNSLDDWRPFPSQEGPTVLRQTLSNLPLRRPFSNVSSHPVLDEALLIAEMYPARILIGALGIAAFVVVRGWARSK